MRQMSEQSSNPTKRVIARMDHKTSEKAQKRRPKMTKMALKTLAAWMLVAQQQGPAILEDL